MWPTQSPGPTRSQMTLLIPASFCARTDTNELNIANRQPCTSVLAREPSKLMSIVQLVFSFCFERTVILDGSRYAKSGLSPSWYCSTPHSCPAITRVATTLAILAREQTASSITTSALIYSVTPQGTLVPWRVVLPHYTARHIRLEQRQGCKERHSTSQLSSYSCAKRRRCVACRPIPLLADLLLPIACTPSGPGSCTGQK